MRGDRGARTYARGARGRKAQGHRRMDGDERGPSMRPRVCNWQCKAPMALWGTLPAALSSRHRWYREICPRVRPAPRHSRPFDEHNHRVRADPASSRELASRTRSLVANQTTINQSNTMRALGFVLAASLCGHGAAQDVVQYTAALYNNNDCSSSPAYAPVIAMDGSA